MKLTLVQEVVAVVVAATVDNAGLVMDLICLMSSDGNPIRTKIAVS
jgi:hypothetical protein